MQVTIEHPPIIKVAIFGAGKNMEFFNSKAIGLDAGKHPVAGAEKWA